MKAFCIKPGEANVEFMKDWIKKHGHKEVRNFEIKIPDDDVATVEFRCILTGETLKELAICILDKKGNDVQDAAEEYARIMR